MLEEKRKVIRHIPVRGLPKSRLDSTKIMLAVYKSRHGYEHVGHPIGCLCEGCEFEVVAGANAGDVQAKELLKNYV